MVDIEFSNTVDVIDYLGGNYTVAKRLGTSAKAVANWRYAGRFPANTYLAMQQLMKQRKCRAPDTLWAMKPLARVKKDGKE